MVPGIGSPQISPYSRALTPTGGAATGDTNASGATLVAANAHREASGDLSIVTREGDTVTISAHVEADATYASLRTRGASASYRSLEASSSLEIQVQGDLSAEEMADIQKLVKQFGHELRQFFKGSPGAAATDVGRGEFSSLTGFAVHFDASQSLTVTAAVLAPAGSGVPKPAPEPLPSSPVNGAGDISGSPANPVGGLDEDGDAAAQPTVTGQAGEAVGIGARELSDLVGSLLKLARHSGVPSHKLADVVGRVFDKAAGEALGRDKPAHILDHVRREVQRGIEATPAEPSRDFEAALS